MQTRRTLYILCFVGMFGTLFALAKYSGYQPSYASRGDLVGEPVPEISLPFVTGEAASEGERLALSALHGEVVILDFWATWCGPCRESIPVMNQLAQRYADRVHVYGVNVERGVSVTSIVEGHRTFGARFDSLHDVDAAAQNAFQINQIPTIVIIDVDGTVAAIEVGMPNLLRLSTLVDGLLHQ